MPTPTFQVTGQATPNQVFSINVTGSAIVVNLATDNTGTATTTIQEMYDALLADAAVTALVTPSGVEADPTELFNANYGPTDIIGAVGIIILGEVFCFTLTAAGVVSIPTSQICFQGVRRNPGAQPLLGSCTNYKPETYTYVLTGQLEVGQTKGYLAGQAPVTIRKTINDFDFELHEFILTFQNAAGADLPLVDGSGNSIVYCAMMPYDAVKQAIANIPPLDKFWNGAPGSQYKNGALVPPLLYPQQTQIRVDLFNLTQDANLPITVTVHCVGKNRKPC